MDQQTLQATKEKVQAAETLQKKINTLDEVISSCNAEKGYIDIRINYRNQDEIALAATFGADKVYTAFGEYIVDAAEKEKARLEKEFKELKF